MNPPPFVIAYIQSKVTDWTKSDAAVLSQLASITVPNPVKSAPQVPKPYGWTDLFGKLDKATIDSIVSIPLVDSLIDAVNAGDVAKQAQYVAALVASGRITAEQAAALQGVMQTTVPDPGWVATITEFESLFGRKPDAGDVADARAARSH